MLATLDTALYQILQRFPGLEPGLPTRCSLVSAPAWRRRCLGASIVDGTIYLRLPTQLLEEDWVTRLEWMVHGILHGLEQEEKNQPRTPYRHSLAFRQRAASIGLTLRKDGGDFKHGGCDPELLETIVTIAGQMMATPVEDTRRLRPLYRLYRCGCNTIAVRGTVDAYCPRCDRDLVPQRGRTDS